jgi:hypothetical protein
MYIQARYGVSENFPMTFEQMDEGDAQESHDPEHPGHGVFDMRLGELRVLGHRRRLPTAPQSQIRDASESSYARGSPSRRT